ncbi:MAG: arginine--tRNA ligase [Oscillospiraceae bacterium]|jgi:arginyl-tRNA synthetase|nr:arginine--tRNA ligase [Oscillospiraceae bacterium]
MINMIQNAKDQVLALTEKAYEAAAAAGKLPAGVSVRAGVEIPKDPANGDYTTTFALAAAKAMKMRPRDIAEVLLENIDLEGSYFASAEIAGAGFLNFRLGSGWYAGVMSAVESEGAAYGRSDILAGQKIMVEFVSANPTGPMHMGNARGGVLGDTLASVLEAAGAQVWREFYVNDAGNQIEKFASSLEARYLQIILGEDAVAFPEDGYHGDDIRDLARAFYEKHGGSFRDASVEERHKALAQFGLEVNIPKMKSDLQRYKIDYDQWFFESELHESGYVAETVQLLTDRGWTYEKEGALWLATSRILEENYRKAGKSDKDIAKLDLKDDVLRRANGFYTYFAADIAYHRNKFAKRGFDRVINIWGADHHGHVARLKGAMDALGLDGTNRLDIVLMQLVKLLRDGEVVRMSKRTGKAISLSDLLDEVPVDAARWFFNAKPDTQMDFDLGLAVREDSENPIYYVEYAHARICSLLRNLAGEGFAVPAAGDVDVSLLSGETELALMKQISLYCETLRLAARDYDPSHINRYLVELAGCFHRFYTACRIKGEEPAVLSARLKLADLTRSVLKNGLLLLGVDAPEKM